MTESLVRKPRTMVDFHMVRERERKSSEKLELGGHAIGRLLQVEKRHTWEKYTRYRRTLWNPRKVWSEKSAGLRTQGAEGNDAGRSLFIVLIYTQMVWML